MSDYSYARAKDVMSTQSTTAFEWSVTLSRGMHIVGIGSRLQPENRFIYTYDQNAIVFLNWGGITRGSKTIHSNLPIYKHGDVIRFTFQPQRKKLVIDLEVSKKLLSPHSKLELRVDIMK